MPAAALVAVAPLEANAVTTTIYTVAWIFLILLIVRLVFEYVFMFARDFTPRGVVLIIVEAVYTVTDPPLKLLRRFIPPLRLGNVSIDLSFIVLIVIVNVVIHYTAPL